MERDETLVAQELATSSGEMLAVAIRMSIVLTGAVVVGFKQGEHCADGKHIGEVGENHVGGS